MVKISILNSSEEILQQDREEFLRLSSSEEEENDLSYWEIVNPSDADDDIDIDFDNISLDSYENGLFVSLHSSLSSSIAIPQKIQNQNTHFETSLDQDQQEVGCVGCVRFVGYQYRDDDDEEEEDVDEDMNCDDDDDEYDDDGDEYDLDDELVPRSVRGKLERQRMRKLGKRAFARMYNSKKSPLLYTKPGCVHGKHGLGLKHSC